MRSIICLLAAVFLFASHNADGAAPATPPAKESFHIYLLMGQSNMQGRDTTQLGSQVDNPRILALTGTGAGEWTVARDPMFPPRGRTIPGVGPGIPFATVMLKSMAPTSSIGLVPTAVGGSSLNHWVKGGDFYEQTIKMARVAAQYGTIDGVLWHQGESDSNTQKGADTYAARLKQMFADLRHDLNLPDLPIVVGQIGPFLEPEKYPFADTVRAAIKGMPAAVPHVGYADSTGLTDRGDKLHFNADSQKQLGARFAAAMQSLQK